jgi:hypothetical protein
MKMFQIIYGIPIIIMIAAIVRLIKKDISNEGLDMSIVDLDPKVKILQGSISRGKHKNL